MIGGQCSGSDFPQDGTCTEQCYDGNMNSYVAKMQRRHLPVHFRWQAPLLLLQRRLRRLRRRPLRQLLPWAALNLRRFLTPNRPAPTTSSFKSF